MAPTATQLQLVALILTVAVACCAAAATVKKRSVETQFSLKDKRPFCNAFTGCGRKRSAGPLTDNSIDSFKGVPPSFSADSRAELDELARHVLAQARLWEQLQHKVELLKSLASAYPDPAAETPYRRRKRAALVMNTKTSSHHDSTLGPQQGQKQINTKQEPQQEQHLEEQKMEKYAA